MEEKAGQKYPKKLKASEDAVIRKVHKLNMSSGGVYDCYLSHLHSELLRLIRVRTSMYRHGHRIPNINSQINSKNILDVRLIVFADKSRRRHFESCPVGSGVGVRAAAESHVFTTAETKK